MVEAEKIQLHRGLRDVYIDRTRTSFIDGREGKLLYRGYNIHDLAENSTFEEIVYLLLYGVLPTRAQLDQIDGELKASRKLPPEVSEVIRITKNAHPMDVLRTAISALSTTDSNIRDNSREAILRKGIRLTAAAPTIVATHARICAGKKPVEPNPELGHAGNFLYMHTGQVPHPEDASLMDKDFVLHAEHGINASAFAARVAASTEADLHCAITTGVAVLKGPAHGGAAESVMHMAEEIGSAENAAAYVQNRLKSGGRIVGFGHRVYKTTDPRAVHLREDARRLGERKGHPEWFAILQAVSNAMEPYAKRGICQNVDFWSGAIYHLLGIPTDLFICIFAMGRIPGWTAQVMEQAENNILLRPMLAYEGPMDLPYVPIEKRG
ncbi:MAG: citrate (Si)-synthase [SAR202 cluster bacterium]|nr:citrate (Si)-synthase [SAR202 cluster bacterium]